MVAQSVIFMVAGHITLRYGWQGVWWFVLAICLIASALYAWKVTSPPPEYNHADSESSSLSLKKGLKCRGAWLLSVSIMAFCFSCFGFTNWIALYWSETFGWDINRANSWVGSLYFIEIFMVVAVGWVLDRLSNWRKTIGVVSLTFSIVISYICFRMTNPALVVPFVLAYALLEGAIPTAMWTLCAQTVRDPSLAGVAFGILSVGLNLGAVLGPPVTGYIVEHYGWHTGSLALAVSSAIGTIALAMVKIFTQEEQEKAAAEMKAVSQDMAGGGIDPRTR